jgi:hypothetical protein
VGIGPSLDAWGKRGRFSYAGSVETGTRIVIGRDEQFIVSAAAYRELLAHFAGRTVEIGNSRRPARGSLGSWLQAHVGGTNLAAYIGPILTREGYAERVGADVRFATREA